MAVKLGAVQTLKEKPVVFVAEGDAYVAREVELGPKDHEQVQILSGLKAGEKYAAERSFLLKAELGKGEAEED